VSLGIRSVVASITCVNHVSNVTVLYGHSKYSISHFILFLKFFIEIILILFAAAVYKSADWVYCFHGVTPCSLVIYYRPFGSIRFFQNGPSIYLQNLGDDLADYTAPRKIHSPLLWEPRIPHGCVCTGS
jgi:hypothetical protein